MAERLSVLMMSTHGYVAADPQLGLPDTGGQVVFVLELARHLDALGHRVDIVTRRFEGQPEVDEMGEGLRIWRIPFGGDEFIRKEQMHDHIHGLTRRLVAEIRDRRIRYDVVSSHYWDAGWAATAIGAELGIPHVHTPHSLGTWKRDEMGGDPESEAAYRFDERIYKEGIVYRHADRVIATTPQQAEAIVEGYGLPRHDVSVIPPGIDLDRYRPASERHVRAVRTRLGLRRDDVYTVGRAAHNKGYDLLIRALPSLRRSVPDARLVMAVGADAAADRRRIRRWDALARDLGVAAHVEWRGHVDDSDMADSYRAAGVFALPSRYEPFGMTAVEAMACGAPCVITVHGGLAEMFDFGTQALYADPNRATEYATMLSLPLRYPRLRERLAVDGGQWARSSFGWGSIAQRTVDVVADVMTTRQAVTTNGRPDHRCRGALTRQFNGTQFNGRGVAVDSAPTRRPQTVAPP